MSMELNKEIYKLIEEALGLNAGLINFESDNNGN